MDSRRTDPRNLFGAVASLVALGALLLIPLKIVATGFRPMDDALRHAAMATSDRTWPEVLVLRPEATVDPHPGWHAFLRAVHRLGIETPTGLVVFSTTSLAALVLTAPLLWRWVRGEAWLLALLVAALGSSFFERLMLGRPFLISMWALVGFGAIWTRLKAEVLPRTTWLAMVALFAVSVWMHGNWYLWALPIGCLVLAGESRAASRATLAALVGSALGALATGSPVAFLTQTLKHPFWALATELPVRVLVFEFRPSSGDPLVVVAVAFLLVTRHLRGLPLAPLRQDPLALLATSGWILGFQNQRLWMDWGLPAALLLIAREIDAGMDRLPAASRPRLLLAVTAAAALVLAVTSDRGSRWSRARNAPLLSLENPAHRPWLPEPDGILYSNDMRVFYSTFFKNPHASWRYMVGFEPALMPPADLAVFRRIQLDDGADATFAPWIRKMRPSDRLVIVRRGPAPRIDRLEWSSPYRGMWIGRLPRNENGSSSADSEAAASRAARRADGDTGPSQPLDPGVDRD